MSNAQTEENVDQVKGLVLKNRKITIHEVANMLDISIGSVQSISKKIPLKITTGDEMWIYGCDPEK
jgi:hypothetical protein